MLDLTTTLPEDADDALLIGRLWLPGLGPLPVACVPGAGGQNGPHGATLHDLTRLAPTVSGLLALDDPAAAVRRAVAGAPGKVPVVATLADALANSDETSRDTTRPWLLAPCDLQVIKASGVTFVASLLERVIEEQARGDATPGPGPTRQGLSSHPGRQPGRHRAGLGTTPRT